MRLTGTLTAGVTVTLPLPGYYVVENLTTGNFVVTLRAVTATQVIGIDQGMCQHVYNDGANVRFVNLGKVGEMEFWTGLSNVPAWVSACTIAPYLLCDGSVISATNYPYLLARYGTNFGGNGVSTVGRPDMRGRVPLAFDSTGSRISVGGCGINGTQMGSAADNQAITLTTGQIPNGLVGNNSNNFSISVSNGGNHFPVCNSTIQNGGFSGGSGANLPFSNTGTFGDAGASLGGTVGSGTVAIQITNTGGQSHSNVQPAQVAGIWVVRAA